MRGLSATLALLTIGCARADEKAAPPSPASAMSAAAPLMTPTPLAPDASPRERCDEAKRALRDFVATFPTTCETTADCGGYFVLEDTCAGPTMLRVPGCPLERKPLLFAYHDDVRKRCPAGPACSPKPYQAACDAGRCVDALERSSSR